MTVKAKNDIWLTVLFVATVMLGIVIQLILGVAQDVRSRWEAAEASLAFVQMSKELAADEKARNEALRKMLIKNSQKAYKGKEARRQELELLILVNPWNEVPENYKPKLKAINDEQAVDVRCADSLERMLRDCRAAGYLPEVCSSYRTYEMQELLYNNKIGNLRWEGYSVEEAPIVAARSVAVPGTSEHQLGLAVDIIDQSYPYLNEAQANTFAQRWLMANCHKYGFILRYPQGTTDITGIIYEPWHYRYVGENAAAEIKELGVTLEEYLQIRRGK